MEYWDAHWDVEFPSLFGISQQELQQAIAVWPASSNESARIVGLASHGSLRELLFGASSLPEAKLQSVIGLSKVAATELASSLQAMCGGLCE
jgi:hypothetical protein